MAGRTSETIACDTSVVLATGIAKEAEWLELRGSSARKRLLKAAVGQLAVRTHLPLLASHLHSWSLKGPVLPQS